MVNTMIYYHICVWACFLGNAIVVEIINIIGCCPIYIEVKIVILVALWRLVTCSCIYYIPCCGIEGDHLFGTWVLYDKCDYWL